jgi:Uma2 family endonuclease
MTIQSELIPAHNRHNREQIFQINIYVREQDLRRESTGSVEIAIAIAVRGFDG